MAIVRTTLAIEQGCTFRRAIACDLSDVGVANIETWPGIYVNGQLQGHAFTLWTRRQGRPGWQRVRDAYLSVAGNTLTLTLTKEATENLPLGGEYRVDVTNGVDRFVVIEGAWFLKRSAWARTQLQAGYEDTDGLPMDMAAVYSAVASPSTSRVFIAHGRRRSAVRVSDASRMMLEDRSFHALGGGLNEAVDALCIDEQASLLFTLTRNSSTWAVYCESIADQTNPVESKPPLLLAPTLLSGESAVDLVCWPGVGEKVLVVVTARRLITVDYSGATMVVKGATESVTAGTPMSDTNPVPANSINTLVVVDVQRAKIGKDGTGKLVAYVRCACLGYELTPLTRPFAQVIVACNLDLAGGFSAPAFRQDNGVFTYYAFYNPFPVTPAAWSGFVSAGGPSPDGSALYKKEHYMVNDFDWFDAGATKYLVCSHGRRNQVRRLTVTDTFAALTVGPIMVCHPSFGTDPWLCKDLHHVNVDPTNVNHLLVAEFRSSDGWRVINGNPPTSITALTKTLSGKGIPRKHVAVAVTGKHFTVWNAEGLAVDYQLRAIDGSTNTPAVLFERGWFMNCDGIVALPPRVIYQLTFGGILPYKRTGPNGEWYPDENGYQPARVDDPVIPGASWFQTNTEEIEIVRDVSAPGDNRLVTCAATLGFMEFEIDPVTLRPGPARLFRIPPYVGHPDFDGWIHEYPPGGGTYYSNDVAVAVIGNQKYVLCDFTNIALGKWALVAFRYDVEMGTWVYVHSVIVPTGLALSTNAFTIHVHVAHDLRDRFALVQADGGFFMVGLSGLPTRGKMDLLDVHSTVGLATVGVITPGVAMSEGRIFVGIWPVGGNQTRMQIRVLDFDTVTGEINNANPVQVLELNTLPSGTTKAFKLRFRRSTVRNDGYGALYVCGGGGELLELEYDPLRPTPLQYRSHWRSDYGNAVVDAHDYDFGDGPQLLVGKNIEGFAIVSPTIL